MRNLIITLLLAGACFSQPTHQRLLTEHSLSSPDDNDFLHIENRGGRYIDDQGWKAVDENSQLFIQCKEFLPTEGTLIIELTNFDPVEQNLYEIKHHIINLYSRVYTNNKDIFDTDGSWCNIRTGSWYSDGPGKAGFKLLAAPKGIDSRTEARCIQSATWDINATYQFRITWSGSFVYCFLNDELVTTLPFANQTEPFQYILLGKDNLIWGYSAQPGPIYKNLRLYGPGDPNPVIDETPPHVLSVQALSSTRVRVEFDEPVDSLSAVNLSNYRIEPAKNIISAIFATNQKSVTLNTEELEENTFQLYIQNIKDTSPQSNIIEPALFSFDYSNQLLITDIVPSHYRLSRLSIGDSVYIDRDFRLTSWPNDGEYYWIKTANDDKYATDAAFLVFKSNKAIQVKVALDAGMNTLPSWISDGEWQHTGQSLETKDTLYNLYEKRFEPGQITLGGNEGDRSSSMYLVMLREFPTTLIDKTPPSAPLGVRVDRF